MLIRDKETFFYTTVEGWMAPIELGYLYDSVYSLNDGDIAVEVGCHRGRSSTAMATAIRDSGKDITLYCIDSFLWEETHHDTFMKNMEGFDIRVIKSESVEAAKLFRNESIKFLFLDADHSYEAVKKDIDAWLPKIKIGGIFSGHDYTKDYEGVIPAVTEKIGHIELRPVSIWEYVKTR